MKKSLENNKKDETIDPPEPLFIIINKKLIRNQKYNKEKYFKYLDSKFSKEFAEFQKKQLEAFEAKYPPSKKGMFKLVEDIKKAKSKKNMPNFSKSVKKDIENSKKITEFKTKPDYYKKISKSGQDVIDVIADFDMDFLMGNVFKYIVRAGIKSDKTTIEDLNKAKEYIDRKIKLIEDNEKRIDKEKSSS